MERRRAEVTDGLRPWPGGDPYSPLSGLCLWVCSWKISLNSVQFTSSMATSRGMQPRKQTPQESLVSQLCQDTRGSMKIWSCVHFTVGKQLKAAWWLSELFAALSSPKHRLYPRHLTELQLKIIRARPRALVWASCGVVCLRSALGGLKCESC